MIKWIYDKAYLEHQEGLFLIASSVIILIIFTTILLVWKELKKNDGNK